MKLDKISFQPSPNAPTGQWVALSGFEMLTLVIPSELMEQALKSPEIPGAFEFNCSPGILSCMPKLGSTVQLVDSGNQSRTLKVIYHGFSKLEDRDRVSLIFQKLDSKQYPIFSEVPLYGRPS